MHFFESIEALPPDAILGLTLAYNADVRPNKVNLGVGVYKTAELEPYILHTVKEAETLLLKEEKTKDYLPIDGDSSYVALTKTLVLGKEVGRVYGAQVAGGTAALRVGAAFLKESGLTKIYLSDPTWANHKRIFSHVGLEIATYPYYDGKNHGFDEVGCLEALKKMPKGAIVLLHTCCHNPTGFDPSTKQWEEIAALVEERELFPFFDCAYQGFGEGLEQDVAPIRLFERRGLPFAAAISHAKNFGLYAERAGVLLFGCSDEEKAKSVGTHVKMLIRGMYSNPPCHGGRIVKTILQDETLKGHWEHELTAMRTRIAEMRGALAAELNKSATHRFDFLPNQRGMFSYTGLDRHQVERLISDYGIYMPADGRINVAGLNPENIGYVAEAVLTVKG